MAAVAHDPPFTSWRSAFPFERVIRIVDHRHSISHGTR
jgi:hypothetical protein